MSDKSKKILKQKNETIKIDFNDVLMYPTDEELNNHYKNLSQLELLDLLKNNLPDKDREIIKKIIKK